MKKFLLSAAAAIICFTLGAAADKKINYSRNVVVKSARNHARQVVIDNIPHVRQKGAYCVPATCSMLLRYYDTRYNQKDLGKLFHSSRKSGTNIGNVYSAFNTGELAGKFDIKPLYSLTNREFAAIKQSYDTAFNKLSANKKNLKKFKKLKRTKKRRLSVPRNDIFFRMDPLLALKVFPTCRPELRTALDMLCRQYINAGIPVMWSVDMHLDPYSDSQEGHMRILNGYVIKNNRITHILYRDSWLGHSGGRQMSIELFLTMTKRLFVIMPKKHDLLKMPRIKLPKN